MEKLIRQACLFLIVLNYAQVTIAQEQLSMSQVENRLEMSMSDVEGKTSNGIYRYYEKGSESPYTGILYSTHANGNIDSWQEYVDGIGQGDWINYYENGNYKEIGHFEQNRVEGPIRKYYKSGQLRSEGTYKDWRIMVGEWVFYNPDGTILTKEDYGEKGSIEEVMSYYRRGEISKAWYTRILASNGFEILD